MQLQRVLAFVTSSAMLAAGSLIIAEAAHAAPMKIGITGDAVVTVGDYADYEAHFRVREDSACHEPTFDWGDGATGSEWTGSETIHTRDVYAPIDGSKPVYRYTAYTYEATHIYCTPGTFTVTVTAPKKLKTKGKRVLTKTITVQANPDGFVPQGCASTS